MDESSDSKLYMKVGCSVCLLGERKGVYTNCPYCDEERKQIIEAPFTEIKNTLCRILTKEQKKELIMELSRE